MRTRFFSGILVVVFMQFDLSFHYLNHCNINFIYFKLLNCKYALNYYMKSGKNSVLIGIM